MTQPVDVSRLHHKAILDLLSPAIVPLQVDGRYRIYSGEVTDDEDSIAYPYLVVWPPPVHRPVNTMAGYDGAATTTTQVTAAGTTVDEVLAALDRAAAALHRRRPAILGRITGLVSQVPSATPPQPDRDDSVRLPDGRPVFMSFLQFSLYSTPSGGQTP
jgi:hypothetical protein